ncbi:hypothetical protein BC831DRAFT_395848 [Entophlyctis helioformis]|nr:hypothetical protein BC831DRAFT_395848 [Entophlyctis helioformis]
MADECDSVGLYPTLDVAHLVLIFNACSKQSAILDLLPAFVKEQYSYLRERFGSIVPAIQVCNHAVKLLRALTNASMRDASSVSRAWNTKRYLEAPTWTLTWVKSKACCRPPDLRFLSQKHAPQAVLYEFAVELFEHPMTIREAFCGVPAAILDALEAHASTRQKQPSDWHSAVLQGVPRGLRKRIAAISAKVDQPSAQHGSAPIPIQCHLHLANIDDLHQVRVEVNGSAVSNVGNQIRFLRPMEWSVEMAIIPAVAHANGMSLVKRNGLFH